MEYKKVKLRDVCTVNQGLQIPISKRFKEKAPNRYFYITIQFLKGNTEEYYIENPKESVLCTKKDILVVRTGSTGIVLTDVEGCFHNNFFKVVPNEKIYRKYLYYALNNEYMYKKMLNAASGTTIPDLKHSAFYDLEISLPEISEQYKIVNILSSIDKKIELNNQINNNLQKLLNTVFTDWFCKYDYPNQNDQPYKSSGGKMIESELGEIPENWTIGIFKDIIDFSNGYGFKSKDLLDSEEKETYKVFKQGNINLFGGINEEKTKSWFYKEKAKGLEKFILKKGDILMCMTDMKNSTSPLLGHTALMNVNDEYIVNQRVGLIRCKKEITDYPYVYTMSNLEYFLQDIRSRANSGVQVNLSTNGICETKIVIPSKTILDKFNNFAKPLYERMFNKQKENRNLEQLRDTLLPKIMNGEIDLENIKI